MTLYRKCERCQGRAGWTDPNSLEWVECEADKCDLGVVPVEEPVYREATEAELQTNYGHGEPYVMLKQVVEIGGSDE